jgi:Tfp pilus assembly protein PilO
MKQFWQRLSQRERGLVLVTLAISVLALARYLIILPFLERWDWVQNQLEVQPQLLEKNLRFVGQEDHLTAALSAARNEIKIREAKLLSGNTPSVSASDLQEIVQGLATKEGVQVITTRVLNPEPTASFSKIAIQMEIGGQIDQIANFVRGIDNSPKLLVVEEINVRSLFRPVGVPQPQGAAQTVAQTTMQNLRVSVTIAGFVRTDSGAKNGSSEPASNPTSTQREGG